MKSTTFAQYYLLVLGYVASLAAFIRNWIYKIIPGRFVPPFAGAQTISAEWFEGMLKEKKLLEKNNGVSSLELCTLDGHRGLVGSMGLIKAKFKTPCNLKSNYIIKTTQTSMRRRAQVIANAGTRESTFLISEYAKCISENIPTVYYTSSSSIAGEIVILMEDLRDSGGINVNFICGNQVWGMPEDKKKYTAEHNLTAESVLEKAFLAAAKLHSKYWNDKRLLEVKWLKSAWYRNEQRAFWELGLSQSLTAWKKVKNDILNKKLPFEFSPKLEKIIDLSFENSSWEKLQSHLHDPQVPFTLCHGDFHAANMYIRENGEIVLFDWCEVGPWEPTADLAQMIISDVKPGIFKESSKKLLRKYWEKLVENGVKEKEYPFETCWKRFCVGGLERWIWILTVLHLYVPPFAFGYFHDQILAFMEMQEKEEPFYVFKTVYFA